MQSFVRSSFVPVASALAVVVSLVAGAASRAAVPSAPPVFSDPLAIDNEYFPFVVDAVKVYRGKSDGERIVVNDQYLPDTRAFDWNGGSVETRVLREVEFEAGSLVEVSWNYFAQADDGSVYYFGEVVDIFEDGTVVSHEGSWLVGGATSPGDPAETGDAPNPALFMPSNPEVGDQFKPEDLFPLVDETVTVEKVVKKLKVEAGKFNDVLQMKETSQLSAGFERKWWAKGVGVVRTKGKGEALNLIASTLEQDELP